MSPLPQQHNNALPADSIGMACPCGVCRAGLPGSEAAATLCDHEIKLAVIDGDHGARVALSDHLRRRQHARCSLRQDIASDACETRHLWPCLAELGKDRFKALSVTERCASASGNVLRRGLLTSASR